MGMVMDGQKGKGGGKGKGKGAAAAMDSFDIAHALVRWSRYQKGRPEGLVVEPSGEMRLENIMEVLGLTRHAILQAVQEHLIDTQSGELRFRVFADADERIIVGVKPKRARDRGGEAAPSAKRARRDRPTRDRAVPACLEERLSRHLSWLFRGNGDLRLESHDGHWWGNIHHLVTCLQRSGQRDLQGLDEDRLRTMLHQDFWTEGRFEVVDDWVRKTRREERS